MTICGRSVSKLCALAALVAALGLVGCGRKGGLDLPPAAAGAQQESAPRSDGARSLGSDLKPSGARSNSRNLPPPPSPKRDLPIDFLLN
jgi:predicted small lipoprotein YifL